MFEITDDAMIRYRCRVGHAWSPETLVTQQVAATESALWTAIRTLEEKAAVHRRLSTRDGATMRAAQEQKAADADSSAALIREMLRDLGRAGRVSD
jgi:two-component system chemotaxis response regulator CheB